MLLNMGDTSPDNLPNAPEGFPILRRFKKQKLAYDRQLYLCSHLPDRLFP